LEELIAAGVVIGKVSEGVTANDNRFSISEAAGELTFEEAVDGL
jgi:hypothetical protein